MKKITPLSSLQKQGLENCVALVWVGDGQCDDYSNTPDCNYDGGDCCKEDIHDLYCQLCECKSSAVNKNKTTLVPPPTSLTGNKTIQISHSQKTVELAPPLLGYLL